MFLPAAHCLFLVAIGGTAVVTDSVAIGLGLAPVYALGVLAVRRGWAIPAWVETVAALALVPPAWLFARAKGDADLIAFQYWMTVLLVVRAWKRLERRDYVFSLCMAAGIFTQIGKVYSDLPILFLTLLNLLLAPHALHEVMVRFHQSARPASLKTGALRRVTALGGVSAGLAAVMTGVFLLLPRGGQSTALRQELASMQSGFSDNVSLGTFSSIKQNHQIAMRVATARPGMWRCSVMDLYRGGTWHPSGAQYRWRKGGEPTSARPGISPDRHRVEILNLGLVNYRFFSRGDVVDIQRIRAPEIIWINDLNGTLGTRLTDVRLQRSAEYEIETVEGEYFGVTELTGRRWALPWGGGTIPENELYLQVPEDVSSAVRELAARLTGDAATVAERVAAVEDYLRANMTYSLTDLDSGDMAPLDYFLFQQRSGHCEYFATAMAMLLRCAGVHTRTVQGFGPGILVDDYYVVRMSDAHLWVDVFYPGQGWRSHDPTPVMASSLEAAAMLGTWFDRLQIKWLTYVMDYDGGLSFEWLAGLSSLFHRQSQGGSRPEMDPGSWHMREALIIGLTVCGVALLAWLLRCGCRRIQRRGGRAGDEIPRWFVRYRHALSRCGYGEGDTLTAHELLQQVSQDSAIEEDAQMLTELYCRVRYRGDVLGKVDLDKAEAASRRIAGRVRR